MMKKYLLFGIVFVCMVSQVMAANVAVIVDNAGSLSNTHEKPIKEDIGNKIFQR